MKKVIGPNGLQTIHRSEDGKHNQYQYRLNHLNHMEEELKQHLNQLQKFDHETTQNISRMRNL